MANVQGCHIVGSVPLADTESVLRAFTNGLPNRLKRMPDGETGSRNYFTGWQFAKLPKYIQQKSDLGRPIPTVPMTPQEVEDALKTLHSAGPLETGYDVAAIDSYETFARLKREGVVSKLTRFQVCIPTAANVLGPHVRAELQAATEPIYEAALYKALRNIQDAIPHDELAIQIDSAVDTAYWEGVLWKPYFGGGDLHAVRERIVEYTFRMIEQIDSDVEVGIHNCYGDIEHAHFMEPTSLTAVIERTVRTMAKMSRPLNFVHFPVPRSANDNLESYCAPLKDMLPMLKQHKTDLYLGVIHPSDVSSTERMIEAANKILDGYPFGIATECGWGRISSEQVEEILGLSKAVSKPL
nr:hypothetical protein B0A51_07039 [Rachicladosporium sp. CCFEE 5018]